MSKSVLGVYVNLSFYQMEKYLIRFKCSLVQPGSDTEKDQVDLSLSWILLKGIVRLRSLNYERDFLNNKPKPTPL